MGAPVPQMLETIVLDSVETAMSDGCPYTRHEIHPEGYLGAVERCLLDDTLGAVGHVGYNHIVLLVGSIAEEIALEDCLRTRQFLFHQQIIGIEYSLQLIDEGKSGLADVNHRMIFSDFSSVVELTDFYKCFIEGDSSIFHCFQFVCKGNKNYA